MPTVRKMWTVEARKKALLARQERAGKTLSNSSIQAPTYTHPSAQVGLHGDLSPTQPSPRFTPPEHTENGGGVNHTRVANTILSNYGGSKFKAMTSASNFTSGKTQEGHPYLSFKIPRSKGITHVKTVLKPDDTYSVHMIGVHGTSIKDKHIAHGIHSNQLQSHFTDHTGLITRL